MVRNKRISKPIATSRDGLRLSSSREPTFRTLGGIKIWGVDDKSLDAELLKIRTAIETASEQHLSAIKNVIRSLASKHLGRELDERIFSAVLGWSLRRGAIDAFVCGSKSDRPFRIVVHSQNRSKFFAAVETARNLLAKGTSVRVSQVETALFDARRYNTWSSAMQVLGTIVHSGYAEFTDDGAAIMIEDAQV